LRFQDSPVWPRAVLCLKKRDKEEKVKGREVIDSKLCHGRYEFPLL
jgi:hypothetical protein